MSHAVHRTQSDSTSPRAAGVSFFATPIRALVATAAAVAVEIEVETESAAAQSVGRRQLPGRSGKLRIGNDRPFANRIVILEVGQPLRPRRRTTGGYQHHRDRRVQDDAPTPPMMTFRNDLSRRHP